jgi:CRISPR type III-B/RAMP module RAMP protein Cmr4
MKFNAFIIETLSNLHAGSGDAHFGFVDNLIQRNPVTGIPVVHASGIKGALRENIEKLVNKTIAGKEITPACFDYMFGDEFNSTNEKKEKRNYNPGHFIFMEANMVVLPLRSTKKVFYYSASPSVLIDNLTQINSFGITHGEIQDLIDFLRKEVITDEKFKIIETNGTNADEELEIEDFVNEGVISPDEKFRSIIKELCGLDDLNNFALFNDDTFKDICECKIPVIARNKIDGDGISENLFYEEVLPRKTKLIMILGDEEIKLTNNPTPDKTLSDFAEILTNKDSIFQFGGNFSVGYGFSKIRKINFTEA